jgi:hypothetical protein
MPGNTGCIDHIKTVHNKNTDDIILSLAIEENLFTKVQCLIKDKHAQNKAPLQKQIPPPLTGFIFDCACMGIDAIAGPGILTGRF